MEQTLVLVKPDGVKKNLIGDIIARFEHKGLQVAALKLVKVTEAQAKFHYAEHEGKPFFGELVDFITSAPLVCAVIRGENAIKAVRQLNGATRTGDKGTTGLYTGERVPKQSLRVEAYGTVDEISSALGLARAQVTREDVRETIFNVQKLLMSVMADIASLNLPEPYIKEEHVKLFEDTIDKFDSLLQPLGHFIIPGDTVGAAALDIARTTTRRAERCLLRLAENEPVNPNVLVCLNRLSDLCFILARVECEVK